MLDRVIDNCVDRIGGQANYVDGARVLHRVVNSREVGLAEWQFRIETIVMADDDEACAEGLFLDLQNHWVPTTSSASRMDEIEHSEIRCVADRFRRDRNRPRSGPVSTGHRPAR